MGNGEMIWGITVTKKGEVFLFTESHQWCTLCYQHLWHEGSQRVQEKMEVIKHSAAVHIQNSITLLQRRAWNVLLAHAYDELLTEEEHGIRTKDLMRMLEFDSKNEEYLKESLEALVSCKVRWNVLDKDHHWEWGVTTLLAHATIKSGLCTYSYSPPLRKRLYNPTLYARISLSLQNKFDSKHSLALWELCVDYLDESKRYGETPFIPLEKFKDLLGLSDSTYVNEFKILNRDVIKPAVEEINNETDFQVTIGYQRRGRKVVAVQFRIRRVLQIPEPHARQATLFPELEDMPVIVKELQQAGLGKHDAWEMWQQSFLCIDPEKRPEHDDNSAFERYVREKIHLLQRRYSSATTLIMKRLKFDGQKLSKCPDMIRQSRSHARGSMTPFRVNQFRGLCCLLRQGHAQAHMRPSKVVEGLKEHHAPSHLGAIFTKTPALTAQGSQGVTQREVKTLDQTGADRQSQLLQPLGATAHAVDQCLQAPFVLLFDHLAINQIGMWFLDGLLGASRLTSTRKGLQAMVDLNERRQITAEAITEKAGNPQDYGSRHPDELQGTGKRPWPDKGRQDETKFRGETDPDPLPPVLAQLGAFPVCVGLLRLLAPDKAPHLVKLDLRDGQVSQQVDIDLLRLFGGSSEPLQDGLFRHAQDKTNIRKGDFDQEHFQGHDDLVFWSPQVKKDGIARLGESTLAVLAAKDAPLTTPGQIGRDGAHVATVDQPIRGTIRVGAWLAPSLGFPHGSNLRSSSWQSTLIGGLAFLLFQSTTG